MPAGRPTKYLPEFCEMLVEHMKHGYSYDSFAGEVDVAISTLYEWEKNFPEFSEAKKRAFAKCLRFWEKLGIQHVINVTERGEEGGSRTETLNTGVWVFNMKNRFRWTDRVEVAPADPPQRPYAQLTDEELDALDEGA